MGDAELLAKTEGLALREKELSGEMLRHLGEVDKRKLYAGAGYRSMFHYCIYVLRISESESMRRVAAARAARRFVRIHVLLRQGKLNLNTVAMVAPHLTEENYRGILNLAGGKSVRELDAILAGLLGRPEKRDRVRHVAAVVSPPAPKKPEDPRELFPSKSQEAGDVISAARSPDLPSASLIPESDRKIMERRVQIQFTAAEAVLNKLDRVKELMRGRARGDRYEHVLDLVLDSWLERNDPARVFARKGAARALRSGGAAPRSRNGRGGDSRYPGQEGKSLAGGTGRRVPAAVKAAVFLRDGGRCVFKNEDGRRCEADVNLEYDHVLPFADGGRSDDPGNIRLLCRAHNLHEARRRFGDARIEEAVAKSRKAAEIRSTSP